MTQDIALTRPDATLTMDTLRAQMEAAKRFVDSGLLPAAIKTPQQALTIMQMGRELGIPATYALRNIHVINGKPVAAAELLMSLVRRSYGQSAIRVADASSESCTVEYREQGWDGVSSLTFTIEDAKRAKLDSKDVWKAYPRAMLRSRAVSEVVRTAFPECIANLYTPEEMGADVTVTSDGGIEIVDVPAEPVAHEVLALTCEDCGEYLEGIKFKDGTEWSPDALAEYGRRKHSRILCMEHYREANRAQREVDAQRDQVAF
jgi:hypothetical protein